MKLNNCQNRKKGIEMLRELIVDTLQGIDVEVTELSMMRVYLSVESEVENILFFCCIFRQFVL